MQPPQHNNCYLQPITLVRNTISSIYRRFHTSSSLHRVKGVAEQSNNIHNSEAIIANKHQPPKQFAIYYGYPSCMNSTSLCWDTVAVAHFIAQFNSIILGGSHPGFTSASIQWGLHTYKHEDHGKTEEIIRHTLNIKPDFTFYGYVTIGSGPHGSGPAFSINDLSIQIQEWRDMGCSGIFVDESGFDYWKTGEAFDMRQRQ
jgi:hypothetical protein